MSGDFVAGFTDGEGCFYFGKRKDTQKKDGKVVGVYYRFHAKFILCLHSDDIDLLEKIRDILTVGGICKLKKLKQASLTIQNLDEIKHVVIPFFRKYCLHGRRRLDFDMWTEAAEIMWTARKGKRSRRGEDKVVDAKLNDLYNRMRSFKKHEN